MQVIDQLSGWKELPWSEAIEKIDVMKDAIEVFAGQCKRLPRQLKDWEAYLELKQEVEDF